MITISYLPKLGLGLALMFTLSCALTFALPSLPDITSIVACAIALGMLSLKWRTPIMAFALSALLGCLHTLVQIQTFNQWIIPEECVENSCYLEGKLDSIRVGRYRDVAVIRVHKLYGDSSSYAPPYRITAFFPKNNKTLTAGCSIHVKTELAAVHGHLNPGTYDAERQAMTQWIQAEGKVTDILDSRPPNPLMRMRALLLSRVELSLNEVPSGWVVPALVFGERTALPAEKKEILLRTGTTHLMAISGLHVGVIAAWVSLLIYLMRRLAHPIYKGTPHRWTTPIAAILATIGYSALAGFALPTIRACFMIGLCLLGELLTRRVPLSHRFIYALTMMVIFDPFVCLQPGFWLSFIAVLFISIAQLDRYNGQTLISQWWAIQVALFLGLLPLSIYFFKGVSIIGPVANAIAIPWVSFLVLPLAMMGTLVLMLMPSAGVILLQLCALSMHWLMWCLDYLSQIPSGYVTLPSTGLTETLLGMTGAVLWVLLRPHPLKWIGILLCLPMLLYTPIPLKPGEFNLHLLDVGQGLSVVVETQHHTLVYDTGPTTDRQGGGAGGRIVRPFLNARGHRQIQMLILSHLDADHIGGHADIVNLMKPGLILSSGNYPNAMPCEAGQSWAWDGVTFTMLAPSPNQKGSKNNRSCVLYICTADRRCSLLAGDIEETIERKLIAENTTLKADVLVVPHHGSKSSSSDAFIAAVSPVYAINASGYRNRYHHPHAQVVERYQQAGVLWHDTKSQGAITYESGRQPSEQVQPMRPTHCRWWHRGICNNLTAKGTK